MASMISQNVQTSLPLKNVVGSSPPAVWVIVGASRGIGLEFVRQLLLKGHHVYAVIRDPSNASHLWQLAGAGVAKCELLQCDITDEGSITVYRFPRFRFAKRLLIQIRNWLKR